MMRSTTKYVGASLALALVFAALPALAAEGRIPVWQPIVIGPGGEGKYILTRDITAAGAPAIDVLANTVAVDIDLNGFTIYASNTVAIRALRVDSLTVRNGTLVGGFGGVRAEDCPKVVVEDLKVQSVSAEGIGLYEVANFAVRRNIVQQCEINPGIMVDGFFLDPDVPSQGSIEDNVVRECEYGIAVGNGSSVGVINNRVEDTSAQQGILLAICDSCLVKGNTVQGSTADGILLFEVTGSKVHNNLVTKSASGEGIWLQEGSDHNLVLDNVASLNGNNGLLVDGRENLLERNVLNANGTSGVAPFWGMYLNGTGNVYRGNQAQSNPGGAAACPGFPATTDFCDATGGFNFSPLNQPPTLSGDNLMPNLL
jgi:parallel beta-helix repeat protein